MKHLCLPFLFLLGLFSNTTTAQVKSVLKEEVRAMSEGSFNAIVLELPATSADKVEDAWKSFMKKYKGKTKYSKKNKEFFTDDTEIKGMSENSIDVYAKVEDRGDAGSELVVWFNLGVTYLSQKEFADRFQVAEKMLDKFTQKLSADMLEDILKEEEKLLKDMEKDLKDLEKDQKKNEKDIEDAKETIKKMEENIKESEKEIKEGIEKQGEKKKEIDDQSKKVKELEQKIKQMK